MNEWLGANAIANCWSRIAQELPSRGRFRRELNLAQNAVLSRHAIGKGPAGTTETLETWSWVRGDLGGLSPVNFSRPYGTSRRSNLYPGLRPITLTCLADNRNPRRGFFFVSNSPQKRHPERRTYGTQSWLMFSLEGSKFENETATLPLLYPYDKSRCRLYGRRLRPKARIVARGVKTFEESIFGPCTLRRTWGTCPEP